MTITAEQERTLTESKYFKAEIGRPYLLIMKNWRYGTRRFREEQEDKPVLLADVLETTENGYAGARIQEWASAGITTNLALMNAIRRAEREGRTHLRLHLLRKDHQTYEIVDLDLVATASRAKLPEGY